MRPAVHVRGGTHRAQVGHAARFAARRWAMPLKPRSSRASHRAGGRAWLAGARPPRARRPRWSPARRNPSSTTGHADRRAGRGAGRASDPCGRPAPQPPVRTFSSDSRRWAVPELLHAGTGLVAELDHLGWHAGGHRLRERVPIRARSATQRSRATPCTLISITSRWCPARSAPPTGTGRTG